MCKISEVVQSEDVSARFHWFKKEDPSMYCMSRVKGMILDRAGHKTEDRDTN